MPTASAMPMMMPVAFPVMMSVSIPNSNVQGAGDNVAVKPKNTAESDFDDTNFSINNSRARTAIYGTNSNRPPKTDYARKSGARLLEFLIAS